MMPVAHDPEKWVPVFADMMTNAGQAPRSQRLPKFVRILMVRPRLLVSVGVGLSVFFALSPTDSLVLTRLLVGWNAGVGLYLMLALRLAATSERDHIRRRARLQDEGQIAILVLTAGAAFATLAAIFALLGTTGGAARAANHLVLTVSTVTLSWAFTHTIFGLHYAHEFYDDRAGKGGGLEFPGQGGGEPDYWDFFYFSFVIGMCAQVSDITVSRQAIRRTVFAHSVISFVFNVALVALVVNVAASAILTQAR
jgi:uncharacterized membrane protein